MQNRREIRNLLPKPKNDAPVIKTSKSVQVLVQEIQKEKNYKQVEK